MTKVIAAAKPCAWFTAIVWMSVCLHAGAQAPIPEFQVTDCPFQITSSRIPECGIVAVSQNRHDAGNDEGVATESTVIRLAVARFASDNPKPAADPVFFLQGGPGAPSLGRITNVVDSFFPELLADRDVVFYDQRGVGFSQPNLFCSEFADVVDEASAFAAAAACRLRLAAQGVDLSQYNSAANAADVNDIRLALGYDQITLYGGSYGTKHALTIVRDFPQTVRGSVIDSVYPHPVDPIGELGRNGQRAFDELLLDCLADRRCRRAHPRLADRFAALVERLNDAPLTVPVTFNDDTVQLPVTGDDLVWTLFQLLYDTRVQQALPRLIVETERGDLTLLSNALSFFVGNPAPGISPRIVFPAVQCREEAPFSSPAEVALQGAGFPLFSRALLGRLYVSASPGANEFFGFCQVLQTGAAAAVANELVLSDVPTLVLSGQYDPITPPRWAEVASDGLSNAFQFEFPATGHVGSFDTACGRQLVAAFVADPDTEPDASCLDDFDPPAFETSRRVAKATPRIFIDETADVRFVSLAPRQWQRVNAGVRVRNNNPLDDRTLVLHQATRQASPQAVLQSLTELLGLAEPPESVGTRRGSKVTWTLYRVNAYRLVIDFALAQYHDTTLLVLLQSELDEHDRLYRKVFKRALRYFVVLPLRFDVARQADSVSPLQTLQQAHDEMREPERRRPIWRPR